jgi:hypothetical protein
MKRFTDRIFYLSDERLLHVEYFGQNLWLGHFLHDHIWYTAMLAPYESILSKVSHLDPELIFEELP